MVCRFLPTCLAYLALSHCAGEVHGEMAKPDAGQAAKAAEEVPLKNLPKDYQAKVGDILKKPAIFCRGKVESFPCCPAVYGWMLDHPHHGVKAWQAAGAKGVNVEKKDDSSFLGTDQQGSELKIVPLLVEANRRIWYLEGTGKPIALAPSLTLKAVLILRYEEIKGPDGRKGIQHQTELFGAFDSKAATLVAKLWGMSVDTAAKNALEQVETFFSGMAWYLTEYPAWGRKLFDPAKINDKEHAKQYELLVDRLAEIEKPKK